MERVHAAALFLLPPPLAHPPPFYAHIPLTHIRVSHLLVYSQLKDAWHFRCLARPPQPAIPLLVRQERVNPAIEGDRQIDPSALCAT